MWEIIRVWTDEGKKADTSVETMRLPRALVDAALGYYADYRREIDEWIARNDGLMAEAEAAWRRRQALGPL